jgi:cytochrome c oxidase subunit 3
MNTIRVETASLSTPEIREKAKKLLLTFGIVSICMMFAGLTSGYLVRRVAGNWLQFQMPFTFAISTAIILISSITMNMASQAAKKGNNGSLTMMVGITFILGIAFGICQWLSWSSMVSQKIFLTGSQSSASSSYLYVISALHLCHIVGGLIALSVVFFKSYRQKYTPQSYLGVKLCAIYWHFLDGLWVYLFVFMYIFR